MMTAVPRSRRLKLLGEALLQAPFFAFVADGEMRYLAVNDYACRELGYEESELLEPTVPDIVTEPLEPGLCMQRWCAAVSVSPPAQPSSSPRPVGRFRSATQPGMQQGRWHRAGFSFRR